MKRDIFSFKRPEFYIPALLSLIGLIGMNFSVDPMNNLRAISTGLLFFSVVILFAATTFEAFIMLKMKKRTATITYALIGMFFIYFLTYNSVNMNMAINAKVIEINSKIEKITTLNNPSFDKSLVELKLTKEKILKRQKCFQIVEISSFSFIALIILIGLFNPHRKTPVIEEKLREL